MLNISSRYDTDRGIRMLNRFSRLSFAIFFLILNAAMLSAADNEAAPDLASEIRELKQLLADQQRQIVELRNELTKQKTPETSATTAAAPANAAVPAARADSTSGI